jgi:O-antigen/teichoic acid export membrane protein
MALGVVLSLVLIPVGWGVIELALSAYPPEVRAISRLYLLFIPLNFAGVVMTSLLQGGLRFNEWNLVRGCPHVAYTLFIVGIMLWGHAGVGAFVVASLAANFLTVGLGSVLVARLGWMRGGSLGAWRDLAGYGLRVHVGSVASVLSERLDQMLISLLLAAADLGQYIVAVAVARLAVLFPSTLGGLAFAKISQAETIEARTEILGRYMRATFAVGLAVAIGLFVAAHLIVVLFFGKAFLAAVPVARVMVLAFVPLGFKTILQAGFKGFGAPIEVSRAELVNLVLAVISLAVLVPPFGLIGAAWAAVLSQSVSAVYMGWRMKAACGVALVPALLSCRGDIDRLKKQLWGDADA